MDPKRVWMSVPSRPVAERSRNWSDESLVIIDVKGAILALSRIIYEKHNVLSLER